ncbi:MAG: hypothetical protein IKN78_03525 [Bacteroidales bacterium]|nr:hypothetical protein [Bacteroidales bacterium]
MNKVVRNHTHSFTGHEHYAGLKIINMNGRLYAPVIARFFSPDNFVQAPEFTQSYNRYSYCLNNPLQWVDPSGELSFNDWYIDSKRNLQWFESTSDYVEMNGEIYSRVGNVVVAFSKNGLRIYGDEHGGMHYLYPLQVVLIGKAKQQQEAAPSSETELSLSYPQNVVTYGSSSFSIVGYSMEQSSSSFSLTDSRGKLNIRYYESGWLGNQYVKTYSTAQVGKYANTIGNVLGSIDAMYSFYKAVQSESVPERLCYGLDGTVDIVGMLGPLGVLLALNYNVQIKNYPTIQKELRRQHCDRNDMIRKDYFPIGYPGMPFR